MASENEKSIYPSSELLLSLYEIAELNFLFSIKEIHPNTVSAHISKDINSIYWIYGHCLGHIYSYLELFESLESDKRLQQLFQSKILHLTRYGVKKDELVEKNFISFQALIEYFLYISEKFILKLRNLKEDHFFQYPLNLRDKWFQRLQHISLHFMGHTGQISIIRRQIEGKNYDFVMGINKKRLRERKNEWQEWWEENKGIYK